MYFNKIPPAANFRFREGMRSILGSAQSGFSYTLDTLGGGLFRYQVDAARWEQKSHAVLDTDAHRDTPSSAAVEVATSGDINITLDGTTLLKSHARKELGVLGQKWVMGFEYADDMRFYGLGQKNTGFEKTGQICKFWNTDAFADFGVLRAENEATDPLYTSIPYLLIKRETGCVGILMNNPYPTFMNLAAKENIAHLLDAQEAEVPSIMLGSYDGTPDLYFIVGKDVREVTRKLQRLCGITPMPPLWALGYHQCRFGYRDLADLEELDAKFTELEIPCDGLWLDIDYMDSFKVFTVDKEGFRNHGERIKALQDKNRKIVPIIDPGVKNKPGFEVFDDGQAHDVFCKTCEGDLFSGFVWPGRTAFPDYSLARTREWWAVQVQAFTEKYNFDGYWIDMNDPSTGSSELEDMLFNDGADDHASYHNQYALGMQNATLEGLKRSQPDKRPFIISRSGFISTSRYSALWTGDNWSNYFHLREGIAMSLNLSLSGVPFNGPDVPGFAGVASPALAVDWHKAGFLFPFFRNHSALDAPEQEPWRFEAPYRDVIIHYIRLRYKLLPYLYNLFIEHAEHGDPMLRPIFYEFPKLSTCFNQVGDQFMVGPAIMQAPTVEEGQMQRTVRFPKTEWFDARSGAWLSGGKELSVSNKLDSTPLFFREDHIVPMLCGEQTQQDKDLSNIELHVFLRKESTARATLKYSFDDGETIQQCGNAQTSLRIEAYAQAGTLHIEVHDYVENFESLHACVITYDDYEQIILTHAGRSEPIPAQAASVRLTGEALSTQQSDHFTLSPRCLIISSNEPVQPALT